MNKQTIQAQVLMPSNDLSADMAYFTNLGFRLDHIFPSDDPAVAIMSGHGIHLRLDKNAAIAPPTIHLLTDHPEQIENGAREFTASNGTIFKVFRKTYQYVLPATQHKFEVRQLQDSAPWVIGRAGMLYRDLIPDRLGGSIIASRIRIPNGGPVPDMVHYHTIGFQLIFCINGWVKLVYEDQGPPFILEAGDCVTQPPGIRHRVLEASDNLEVIEIGVPAEHMTSIDHDMELPTGKYLPDREFEGQTFCHNQVKNATWTPWRIPGFVFRDTGIAVATQNMASVQVARTQQAVAATPALRHDADILFTFVLQGEMTLVAEGQLGLCLQKGDAFVVPPGMEYGFEGCSGDLEVLEVLL